MTISPQNSQSSYLPPEIDFNVNDKVFREILSQRERRTADILNVKENAQFEKRELLTGQQWFSSNVTGAIKTSYTYRLSFDLVELNGGPIGAGATTLTLTANTKPALISIATNIFPTDGYGAAINDTNFLFINDPLLFVRTNIWTSVTQQVIITNNTGSNLSWCVWVFQYIKT